VHRSIIADLAEAQRSKTKKQSQYERSFSHRIPPTKKGE
jgi:hypothetical protein